MTSGRKEFLGERSNGAYACINWMLDQQAAGDDKVYCKILSRTVWFYPPKCIGGFALNLVEGNISI